MKTKETRPTTERANLDEHESEMTKEKYARIKQKWSDDWVDAKLRSQRNVLACIQSSDELESSDEDGD